MISNRFSSGGPGEKNHHSAPSLPLKNTLKTSKMPVGDQRFGAGFHSTRLLYRPKTRNSKPISLKIPSKSLTVFPKMCQTFVKFLAAKPNIGTV